MIYSVAFIFIMIGRYGSGVRNGKEWGGGGVDGRDEAGAGDEVDRAGGYGGSVGDLRFDYCGYYQHWDKPKG